MKLYLDYKKQFKKFLIISILFSLPVFFIFAQGAEELRNKINQKNSDISVLEQEIQSFQNQLDELAKEKSSLSGSIRTFDLTRKKLVKDIGVTGKKIEKTNLEIQGLSKDINTKQYSISNNIKVISNGIKQANEFETESILIRILSLGNFSSIWNDIDNMITIRERIRNQINKLRQVKGELEYTRKGTVDAKNTLLSLKSELADRKKIVEQNANEKKKLLRQTRNSEANYQKLVKERLIKQAAFEKELSAFEAQLQFILDPAKLPPAGALSWPLSKIRITSPYAPRWGGFHRGTDFRASVGTPVKAMAEGVIKGTGNTDKCCPKASFGKWILIEYNNGLSSTYGHLSLISVKKGQKIKNGQVVGYSGNSGSSTGPHLHVSVYVSSGVKVDSFKSKSYPGRTLIQPIAATGAYLDPMDFLPK